MPALDAVLAEKTAKIEAQQRLRVLPAINGREKLHVTRNGVKLLSFCDNDYLALASHSKTVAAAKDATEAFGTGAVAARLVSGNHPLYNRLEDALARYKHSEAAVVFGSGYLANVGTIPALVGHGDLVIADKLVHACILDGIRISGAKMLRFAHNDAGDAARLLRDNRHGYRNCLVITETIFSMDGDVAPLADLRRVCDEHDTWLMTDDAHGIGLSQPVKADIQLGTLSKSIGSYGGYVAGSRALINHLVNTARSFIFSTGLPPATIGAALAAVEIIMAEPERAEAVMENARLFCRLVGLPAPQSPIVPMLVGSEAAAVSAAKALEAQGFLVVAIRPPTVPEGTSRLRFAFSAAHEKTDIEQLAEVVNHARIGV